MPSQTSVGRHLIKQSMPMLIALGLSGLVIAVDTYFVGKLGTQALSALGFGLPIITVVTNVFIGLGIGVTVCVARARGARDVARSTRFGSDAVLLTALVSALTAGVLWLVRAQLYAALGAPPELMEAIDSFMLIWIAGLVPLALLMTCTAILRGTGEMKLSGGLIVLAALAHALLDPWLIFGVGSYRGHGLAGAAIALVAGNAVAALMSFVALLRRGALGPLAASLGQLRESRRAIAKISVPSMVTYALVPIGASLVVRISAGHGPAAVAAAGVASRIQELILIVALAVGATVNPFVGMSLGAKSYDRMREGLNYVSSFVVVWGVVCFALMSSLARPLANLFFHEPVPVELFVDCIRALSLSFAPAAFAIVAGSAFAAAEHVGRSAALMFLRGIGASVPLAALGGMQFGFRGVFLGVALGNLLVAGLGFVWYRELFGSRQPVVAPG